ncbi:MAG: phage holin family protein [Isosphaeraceae bacterium]
MAGQTTVGNGATTPLNGVLGGIGDLGTSVVTLASLQARLAASDLRETTHRLLPVMIAIAAVVPLAFGSVTVGLFAIATWIESATSLSTSASLGVTALGGLILFALTAGIALWRARDGFTSFRRSREEFERNIAWLGTVLKQSGR